MKRIQIRRNYQIQENKLVWKVASRSEAGSESIRTGIHLTCYIRTRIYLEYQYHTNIVKDDFIFNLFKMPHSKTPDPYTDTKLFKCYPYASTVPYRQDP
jgi:hypothetical protein